jgi:hypothetical protein
MVSGEGKYLLYQQFSHFQLSSLIATIMHFNSMPTMKGTILEYIQTTRAP